MQARKRYLLLISCCAFLSIGYIGFFHWKPIPNNYEFKSSLISYIHLNDILENDYILPNPFDRMGSHSSVHPSNCRMETCFDFSRCDNDFKVYVYPIQNSVSMSTSYRKVLRSIQSSTYYTSDPSQACIFVLSLDTLDRDSLSKDYIHNMPSRVERLGLWNNGQNHIIFTLYTGTFPDYSEEMGFDVGKAMLAKASTSIENFRVGFDISLPLFHKSHAEKGGEAGFLESNHFPEIKPYLLAFKGKRYLYGIGSETRNSLYHLHNEKDIILVTTCRHLDNWKGHKDSRCDHDNELYDSYDYEVLLRNSSFCLVPRGRRLGSFRFLEALQAGCIPIILANKWELPFSEVIDWNKAITWGDERLLLQIPDIVRSISSFEQLQMRQQTQVLWDQYFSSVEKITISALEIIRERLVRSKGRSLAVWNSMPGALNVQSNFSDYMPHFPFFYDASETQPKRQYTAIIYISKGWLGPLVSSPMYKLIKNIAKSKYAKKIIIVWNSLRHSPPSESRLPGGVIPVTVVDGNQSLMSRYGRYADVDTDAIFSLDEDTSLSTEELDFAFNVWLTFPDRIVGYSGRTHFYSYSKDRWTYSSRWDNSYSMVLTDAAIYHRYYQYVMTNSPPQLVAFVENKHMCDDILLNFLVTDLIKRPPIMLSQRKRYKEVTSRKKANVTLLDEKSICLNFFAQHFNKFPLLKSSMRLDPVLFKDKVSIQRKKYRQMEKPAS